LTGMSGAVKFLVLFTALLYFGVLVIPPIATQPPTLPPAFETALATTAAASTISTAISLPASLLFAFYGLRRGLAPVMPAVTFSTAVPHTAVGLLLLPLFARLGVVDTFPAVVAAMSVVSTPIGVGTLSTLFSNRNKGLDEFLQTLSLNDLAIIWLYLRSAPTTVASTVLLMWLRSFSELGAFLIVGMRPATVGVYLYETFLRLGTAPAVTVALLVAVFGLVFSTLLFLLARAAER
jgi:ABC-type sulfate transport system permease component